MVNQSYIYFTTSKYGTAWLDENGFLLYIIGCIDSAEKGLIPLKEINPPDLREVNPWARAIADAAMAFFSARQGLLAAKPRGIHRLVRRFLVDSEAIEHLGQLRELREAGNTEVVAFRENDDRRHLYRLYPERIDEIRRWALMNAPPIIVRFRKGIGLRLEPESWNAQPQPDWPWYPE